MNTIILQVETHLANDHVVLISNIHHNTILDTIPSYLSRYIVVTTTLRQHPTYLVVYMFWMKMILVELAPYISIAVLNIALILL